MARSGEDATQRRIRVGTAGWAIPRTVRDRAPSESGTQLERYARMLSCAEINSSFHRPHRRATYERWAASVPDAFRFSVKLPKTITHVARLADCTADLERFLEESAGLGLKRAVVLVQLPPRLAFEDGNAGAFFALLRARYDGLVACEPRHPSWFEPPAEVMLRNFRITRVAADPAIVAAAAQPGGWDGFAYFRWHGTPRIYYSRYASADVARFQAQIRSCENEVWCVFDNTALGAATENALELASLAADEVTPQLLPQDRR